MPEWLLGIIGGGLGAAVLALLGTWLKLRLDQRVSYRQGEEAAIKRARECEERERLLEEEGAGAVAEIRRLVAEMVEAKRLADLLAERFGELQHRYPLAATLDGLRRVDAAWSVICEWGVPIVLSSTEGGGSFLRVTPVFAALLDMTPEEVVKAGPWKLLVTEPGNIERTRLAEADARAGESVIVANTYRARDGRPVPLRWHSTPYMMLPSLQPGAKMVGFSLSFVTVRRKREGGG